MDESSSGKYPTAYLVNTSSDLTNFTTTTGTTTAASYYSAADAITQIN